MTTKRQSTQTASLGSARGATSRSGGSAAASPTTSDEAPETLEREGFLTDRIYRALRDHVRSALPHEAIQSERKLAARYGVSVGTIRRALARLVGDNQIYKVHGKGNFVAAQTPKKRILYADAWGDTSNSFYVRSLGSMAAEAERNGYRMEILPYHPDTGEEAEHALRREAADPSVLALIVPWLRQMHFDALRACRPNLFILSTTTDLPFPGTASVNPDWSAGGYMAADYLRFSGARRLACLATEKSFQTAMQNRLATRIGITVANFQAEPNADPDALIELLDAGAFDGIAFQDDRLASAMLVALESRRPGFLGKCRTVSMANAGEHILPPETARLEVDGMEIGRTVITVIRSMEDGCFRGARVHLLPVLANG